MTALTLAFLLAAQTQTVAITPNVMARAMTAEQTAPAPMPTAPRQGTMAVVGEQRCPTPLRRIGDRYEQGPSFDDDRVRIYRPMMLVGRDGCQIPVVVSDAPQANNGVIRELGRRPRDHPDRQYGAHTAQGAQ